MRKTATEKWLAAWLEVKLYPDPQGTLMGGYTMIFVILMI